MPTSTPSITAFTFSLAPTANYRACHHGVGGGEAAAKSIAAAFGGSDRFARPRRAARELMYGAGGAFAGLARHWPPGRGGGLGGGGGGNGNDDEDWHVDPSWGAAPGVHVVLRNRSDEVYAAAVANLIQMSQSLPPLVRDPSVPLVVLVSWMGAQRKHLDKYRTFYEDMGYEVQCVFNGLRTAMLPDASRAQALKIERMIDSQPETRPVFVHAFSIGTGIYGLLLDRVRSESEKFERLRNRVAGVVFDSGPAPIFPVDVAKGLHTVCPAISRAVWESLTAGLFAVTKARQAFGEAEEALRRFQFKAPQLYFYSLDDKVIPGIHKAVEDFMAKNKQRGVEVYNKWWNNSTHASHLKVHQDEYLKSLEGFVKRCMDVRKNQLSTSN